MSFLYSPPAWINFQWRHPQTGKPYGPQHRFNPYSPEEKWESFEDGEWKPHYVYPALRPYHLTHLHQAVAEQVNFDPETHPGVMADWFEENDVPGLAKLYRSKDMRNALSYFRMPKRQGA